MKLKTFYQVCIMVLLVLISGYIFAQSARELMPKALHLEEVKGNLEEAIDIYEIIVKDFANDEEQASKAQLRLGLCYERLGLEKAREAYQKVVDNYPGRENEVAIARERLARLVQAEQKNNEIKVKPRWTKIDIPTKLSWSVALSPDGKELALVSNKKLWKMPLSSNLGSNIPGAPVQINTGGIEVEWTGLSWSGDGRWIAFNEYPDFDTNCSSRTQKIFIVPSEGGKPEKIVEEYRDVRVVNYRLSLSPGAEELAFSSVKNNKQHIYSIPVEGKVPKKLVDFEAREPVFSPNGKYIAFVKDKNRGIDSGDLGVWVAQTDGEEPREIADAGKASSPIWSPDGEMIAFLDYTNGKNINIVQFGESKKAIKNTITLNAPEGTEEIRLLAGWTPENRIGALITKEMNFGLYTLPAEGGQAAQILKETTAYQPRWSKDGKQIYYVRKPQNENYKNYLASVPAEGGRGEPLPDNPLNNEVKQFAFQAGNRISPDGKWIISSAWTKADTNTLGVHWPTSKIWKIATDGTEAIQITDFEGNYTDRSPCWSPDGEKIAFIRIKLKEDNMNLFGDATVYIAYESDNNPELIVSEKETWMASLTWSPDGKKLAWTGSKKGENEPDVLKIFDLVKKEIFATYKISGSGVNIETAWLPDSKRIAFNVPEGKVIKVLDIENGYIEDIETGLVDTEIYHLDLSPDGKRFVFGGYSGGDKEFWFVEDFLPLNKLAQNDTSEKEMKGIVIKQVWNDKKVDATGTVTQDGNYLSFVDWETGDIAIRNLNTGVNKRLTNGGTWDNPMHFAVNNVISPDGKKIAYSWFDEKETEDLSIEGTYDLKIVDVDTKNVSTLYKAKNNEEVYPVKWLPNSSKIIVQYFNKTNDSYDSYLSVIDTLSGEMSHLMKFNSSFMTTLSLSPDENYIAFDYPDSNDDGNFDIRIMRLNGNEVINLVNHPANDRLLGWIPGTNNMLFASNRSGKNDIWSITINNGKIGSGPHKIISNVGHQIEPIGYSNEGSLYFSLWQRNFESFVVPVDDNSKTLLIDKKSPLLGKNFDMEWFSDGNRLICNKLISKPKNRTFFNLCLLNLKNNKVQFLAEKINIKGPPRLSPDENFVLVFGTDEENSTNNGEAYKINIKTNEVSEVKLGHEISEAHCLEWSKTGDSIFYVSDNKIFIHDLKTGAETVLYEDEKLFKPNLRIMKKENNLVFDVHVTGDKFRLMSISLDEQSTSLIHTYNCDPGLMYKKYCFSPDEKYIYYTHAHPNPGNSLFRIPTEGGKPEKLWESKNSIAGLDVNADNKFIISTYHQELEIRKIENLKQEIEKMFSNND